MIKKKESEKWNTSRWLEAWEINFEFSKVFPVPSLNFFIHDVFKLSLGDSFYFDHELVP